MKKFLTVLLALSVVFTYTVGTAFAADAVTDQEACNAKVITVQNDVEKAINEYAATIVYTQSGKLVTPAKDGNLTKVAVEAGVAKAIADAKAQILNKSVELMADNKWSEEDATALEQVIDKNEIEKLIFETNSTTIYTKAIADAKAEVLAGLAKDTSAYTDEDAKKVKTAVDAAKAALDAVKEANYDADGLQAVYDAKTAYETAVKGIKTIAEQEKAVADAKAEAKDAIKKAADAKKADLKTGYENKINNPASEAKDIADATAKLASLDADIAKVADFYNTAIDAVVYDATKPSPEATALAEITDTKNKGIAALNDPYAKLAELASADLLVQYAKNYAAAMKNEFSKETGLPEYNAASVDKTLDTVIAKINKLDTEVNTYAKIETALRATPKAADEAASLKQAKEDAVKAITTGDYASTKWADANKDAVETIQEEYTNTINAATDADAIAAAVKDAKAKMDALLTIEKAEEQKTTAATKAEEYDANLTEYAKGIAAKNPGAYTEDTISNVVDAAKEVMVDAVIAQNNPKLTEAEIAEIVKANYNNALAVIDGMKTTAELDAAAKTVVDAIAALPTVPTLETKDQYLAVQKMLEDYVATPGADIKKVTNFGLLKAYMTRVIGLEKVAVEDAIKALPANPGIADEAAVNAVKDAVKAYDDAYSKYNTATDNKYSYGYTAVDTTKLTAAAGKVSDAKLTDAAKKVAALPATITVDDKAAVEAARAAYDALTDAEKASFNKDLYKKLVSAEEQLAKVDTEYQKVAVQGNHMKIYSSAKKGYIKISWKASNTDVALDGVEVYRSTKKTSGFKKISTFKVQKSKKYTKNMKKGTKYYFYVKGYKMVGDEKVYTHNSITVARTFRK